MDSLSFHLIRVPSSNNYIGARPWLEKGAKLMQFKKQEIHKYMDVNTIIKNVYISFVADKERGAKISVEWFTLRK